MKIRLRNYRCFEKVEIPLSKFNVIVGRNSSGKSAFLESVRQLSRFSRYTLNSAECWHGEAVERIRCYWAGDEPPVEIECEFEAPGGGGRTARYKYRVQLEEHFLAKGGPTDYLLLLEEDLWMNDELMLSRKSRDKVFFHLSGPGKQVNLGYFESFLLLGTEKFNGRIRCDLTEEEAVLCEAPGRYWRDVQYFNFIPELICGWQEPSGLSLSDLRDNGENLMQTLDILRDIDSDAFEGINDKLRTLNPECQGLTFDRCEKTEYKAANDTLVRDDGGDLLDGYLSSKPVEVRKKLLKRLAFRFRRNGRKITLPASMVSSGLVLFTAYATLLHTTGKPSILMIEEPEKGVHPAVLADIVEWMREIANSSDGADGPVVIMTTHSPYLLDYCEPGEILVFNRKDAGTTRIQRMADIKNIKELLSEFQPGELWTALGEDGIVKHSESLGDEEERD